MCGPKFFGIDYNGDGEVSAFESLLTYQTMMETMKEEREQGSSGSDYDEDGGDEL